MNTDIGFSSLYRACIEAKVGSKVYENMDGALLYVRLALTGMKSWQERRSECFISCCSCLTIRIIPQESASRVFPIARGQCEMYL